jgi:hypothetical protein
MDSQINDTEQFSLPNYHWVILSLLATLVVVCVGSLGFAAFHLPNYSTQYAPQPKNALQDATAKDLAREVLAYLNPSDGKEYFESQVKRDAAPLKEQGNSTYQLAATKIVECAKQMSVTAGASTDTFTHDVVNDLANEIKRIAEAGKYDRGVSYVEGLTRVFCQLSLYPTLVDYKKNYPDQEIYEAMINVHLNLWDKGKIYSVAANRSIAESSTEIEKYEATVSSFARYIYVAVITLIGLILVGGYLFYYLVKQNTLNVYRYILLLKSVVPFHSHDETILRIPMEDKGNV